MPGMKKCPRCELNYIKDEEEYCNICRREMKGEEEPEETFDICPECNEHPVVEGEELCALCLKEKLRQEGAMDDSFDAEEIHNDEDDEIIDLDDGDVDDITHEEEIPPDELKEIDREFGIVDDRNELEEPEDTEQTSKSQRKK